MLILFVVVSWWVVGVAGFMFWWTKEHNLELKDMLLSFVVGILGPFSWAVGCLIHGQPQEFMSKAIIKKRGNGEK